MIYQDMKSHIFLAKKKQLITEEESNLLLSELDNRFNLPNFCESFGLIPVNNDSDIVYESIKSNIGKFLRDSFDMKQIKNYWNELASKFTHKWAGKLISKEEKDKLDDAYTVLKKDGVGFPEYKKNFSKIAKFMNLSTDDIILENVVFSKDEESGKDKIAVRYSKGRQQVIIPNGTCLLHVSPVKDIKELKPAFRSKTKGKYMYPSSRIFFTLGKEIKPTQAGLENKSTFKYTPLDTIRTAYIDPTYTDYNTGAVYVETSFPIKVVSYEQKMKSIFKESTELSELDKYRLMIHEAYNDGLITESQCMDLLKYIE